MLADVCVDKQHMSFKGGYLPELLLAHVASVRHVSRVQQEVGL